MPIESRQGPIHFNPIPSQAYREGMDRIFGKKPKVEEEEKQVATKKDTKKKSGTKKG